MKILILPGNNPDLDGVACALALSELTGYPWSFYGKPQIEPSLLLKRYNISVPPLFPADAYIVVDHSNKENLPPFIEREKVIEVIDHRREERVKEWFPNAKVTIEMVGAAATIITERFMEKGIEPSMIAATFLRSAIYSNTLAFNSTNTTERDQRAFRFLGKYAEPIEEWLLQERNRLYLEHLREHIMTDFIPFRDTSIGIAQLEVFGAEPFLERTDEILSTLRALKRSYNLRYILLNMPDIKSKVSYFVTEDEKVKDVLQEAFGVMFEGVVGKRQGLLLRKQIKDTLNKNIK